MILKAFNDDFFKKLRDIRKKKILFFNGCFDIIHLGHVRMINEIVEYKREGYSIICGLNSDLSVAKQNKSHPLVNNENARSKMLLELGVDCVITFDEETPKELLMYIMPDIVYKGSEYQFVDYYEKEFLNTIGSRIIYVQNVLGYSTTNIYNKIEEHVKDKIRRSI